MLIGRPNRNAKKKPSQFRKTRVKGVTSLDKSIIPIGEKAVVASGDKNSQVLAATVGGAVLGNLIVPGIGGAIFGGLVGAILGNDSRGKGRK